MQKKDNSLSIVIPVLNEEKNLESLTKKIYQNTKNLKSEIIFVDDNSKDNSILVLEKLKKKFRNFRYFVRKEKNDLTQSCFLGIKKSKYNHILILDGDGQHNPIYISKMFKVFLKNKTDFVIGVRKFNKIDESLSHLRFFASKFLIYLIDFLFNNKTNDPMSGFFMFKKTFYVQNKRFLFGKGYKILLDLIYSTPREVKIIDYKIKFVIRKKGKSKMGIKILIILIMFIIKKILINFWKTPLKF